MYLKFYYIFPYICIFARLYGKINITLKYFILRRDGKMNYFSNQYNENIFEVWGKLTNLVEVQQQEESVVGEGFEFIYQLVHALMNEQKVNKESFDNRYIDIKAYEYRCRKNEENQVNSTRAKIDHIVDMVNSKDKEHVGYGEKSSNDLALSSDKSDFDESEDKFDCILSLEALKEYRKTYLVTDGVDIIQTLTNALKGIPEAIRLLKTYITSDGLLRDAVITLCENNKNSLIPLLETC